jgi:hypothetical protein
MKLLIEQVEEIQNLTEANKDGTKSHYIKGIFMQSEMQNKNGRVYPKHILEREVHRYNRDHVQKNRAVGELGHPDTPNINLDRISHKIVELYPDGNNFIGKAKLLDTTMGKTAQELQKGGVQLAVSSRGVGSLKKHPKGYQEVCEDFMLASAADIVFDPSAPDAFVQGIMESKEFYYDLKAGSWSYKDAELIREDYKRSTIQKIEERKLTDLQSFLNKLLKS